VQVLRNGNEGEQPHHGLIPRSQEKSQASSAIDGIMNFGGSTSSNQIDPDKSNGCDHSASQPRVISNEEDENEGWGDIDENEDDPAPRIITARLDSRQPKRRRNSIRRSIFFKNNRLHRNRRQSMVGNSRSSRKGRVVTTNGELHNITTCSSPSREASPARSVRWKDLEAIRAAEDSDSHKVQSSLPS
jgi:hypothetical protein